MKPRNVFLSFLGNANYSMTSYTGNGLAEPFSTRFIQAATVKSIQGNFGANDKIFIFTTEGSLKNWNGEGDKSGLREELRTLNLTCDIENVVVKDGASQEQIWEIFTTIFDIIAKDDNLYIDITSGFRSLPLLILPLINYSKFLKDVSVAKISYGYYDRTKAVNPIYDLTDFSKLQDWTNNANIFLLTGNAKGLAKQIEGESLQNVKHGLERFSEFTLVNRGMDIYRGSEIVQLSKDLEAVRAATDPAEKAVVPILNKVKDQFVGYKKDSAINGFYAVRWCIDNGLIQQAATLLEEFITTYVMELLDLTDIANERYRNVVLKRVQFGSGFNKRHSKLTEEETNAICDGIKKLSEYKALQKVIKTVSDNIRNDVNHAGFRTTPKSYSQIRNLLIEQFNTLCEVLKIRGHQVQKITK